MPHKSPIHYPNKEQAIYGRTFNNLEEVRAGIQQNFHQTEHASILNFDPRRLGGAHRLVIYSDISTC